MNNKWEVVEVDGTYFVAVNHTIYGNAYRHRSSAVRAMRRARAEDQAARRAVYVETRCLPMPAKVEVW